MPGEPSGAKLSWPQISQTVTSARLNCLCVRCTKRNRTSSSNKREMSSVTDEKKYTGRGKMKERSRMDWLGRSKGDTGVKWCREKLYRICRTSTGAQWCITVISKFSYARKGTVWLTVRLTQHHLFQWYCVRVCVGAYTFPYFPVTKRCPW